MAKTKPQIVKRHGHSELYDARKLYASVYAACLTVRATDQEAELIAADVTEYVDSWFVAKHEVTSHDLLCKALFRVKELHPDAAYMYEHHINLS